MSQLNPGARKRTSTCQRFQPPLRNLGLLGSAVPAEAYADAVPIILHRLQHNGSKAALVCVERLAGDTKNVPAIIADNHEWSESKKGGKFTNSKTGEVTNMPHPTEPTVREDFLTIPHMRAQ